MSYTEAALRGMGYTDAALEGLGYTDAALRGCGRGAKVSLSGRVAKGSAAAKARMAYLRSLRGRNSAGKKRGGSRPTAMDYIKAERQRRAAAYAARYGDKIGGGILNPFSAIWNGAKYWGKYAKHWSDETKREKDQLAMLEKLKKQRGGKFELKDLRDGLLGPIGWIRLGLRKSRQRKIDALKKELGVND